MHWFCLILSALFGQTIALKIWDRKLGKYWTLALDPDWPYSRGTELRICILSAESCARPKQAVCPAGVQNPPTPVFEAPRLAWPLKKSELDEALRIGKGSNSPPCPDLAQSFHASHCLNCSPEPHKEARLMWGSHQHSSFQNRLCTFKDETETRWAWEVTQRNRQTISIDVYFT